VEIFTVFVCYLFPEWDNY